MELPVSQVETDKNVQFHVHGAISKLEIQFVHNASVVVDNIP